MTSAPMPVVGIRVSQVVLLGSPLPLVTSGRFGPVHGPVGRIEGPSGIGMSRRDAGGEGDRVWPCLLPLEPKAGEERLGSAFGRDDHELFAPITADPVRGSHVSGQGLAEDAENPV